MCRANCPRAVQYFGDGIGTEAIEDPQNKQTQIADTCSQTEAHRQDDESGANNR